MSVASQAILNIVLRATGETDIARVRRSVAELNRELSVGEKLAAGKGGFLSGIKGTFGEESSFGQTMKLIQGAGAVAGVTAFARSLKGMAEGWREVSEAQGGVGEQIDMIARKLPILGELYEAGRAIRETFDGTAKALKEIGEATARQDRVSALMKSNREGAAGSVAGFGNIAAAASRRAALDRLEGDPRGLARMQSIMAGSDELASINDKAAAEAAKLRGPAEKYIADLRAELHAMGGRPDLVRQMSSAGTGAPGVMYDNSAEIAEWERRRAHLEGQVQTAQGSLKKALEEIEAARASAAAATLAARSVSAASMEAKFAREDEAIATANRRAMRGRMDAVGGFLSGLLRSGMDAVGDAAGAASPFVLAGLRNLAIGQDGRRGKGFRNSIEGDRGEWVQRLAPGSGDNRLSTGLREKALEGTFYKPLVEHSKASADELKKITRIMSNIEKNLDVSDIQFRAK